MMTFTSSSDLSRPQNTDPALPVIASLISNLKTDPVTIALMQAGDVDNPLAELCNKEDVSLEGVLEQGGVFLRCYRPIISMVNLLSPPLLPALFTDY